MKKSRNTRQRAVILDVLKKGRVHLTAEEVYREARKALPTVSLGTVYRNLNFLRDHGMAREIRSGDVESVRFEASRDLHAHFHCRSCRAILDIPLPGELSEERWEETGPIASVESIDLHVTGDCADCAARI